MNKIYGVTNSFLLFLFGNVSRYFTFAQTATCFNWLLLFKLALFNTVLVQSGVIWRHCKTWTIFMLLGMLTDIRINPDYPDPDISGSVFSRPY